MNEDYKRIPYGRSDFVSIIEQNNYYVDKTMYLPMLEDEAYNLFFIRPRRFGKSLFLSMLHAYYDCLTKDKFQDWFGNLWIGQHPTSLQGRYQILHLDFSQIGGDIEHLEEKFNFYLGVELDGFVRDYRAYYSEELYQKVNATQDATGKLALIQSEARSKRYPLYLIIDEYDNFTNTVLNEKGERVYWAMTHAEGFYRDIFKKFKGSFERIFITGVSPVTLDDVTSGFNIGWHISTKPEFNQMLGFSTEDVYEAFNYYKKAGKLSADLDVEKVVNEMKPWYDNYCFSKNALTTQSKVFNCDMVFYYLRSRRVARPQHEDRLCQDEEAPPARQAGRRPQGSHPHDSRDGGDNMSAGRDVPSQPDYQSKDFLQSTVPLWYANHQGHPWQPTHIGHPEQQCPSAVLRASHGRRRGYRGTSLLGN